ncbi:MAG: hypothetical protein QE263_09035 [Vampirovibrionales bacterium]|nr:hypothetical protein [Vampirovibrionales bacterium]
MRSIQSVSTTMPPAALKNSATRFDSVNANDVDTVTFGKVNDDYFTRYTPKGTHLAFALLQPHQGL